MNNLNFLKSSYSTSRLLNSLSIHFNWYMGNGYKRETVRIWITELLNISKKTMNH